MTPGGRIKQAALEIISQLRERAAQKKKELRDIEERKAQIEFELKEANFCIDRLNSFAPEIDGNVQCPHCWIFDGTQTALTQVEGGNGLEAVFRCSVCHKETSIPI
jgi:hypothetical protein